MTVYMLLKQSTATSFWLSTTGTGADMGSGFFSRREDAEKARTLELLNNKTESEQFYVFELVLPNPAASG
jgi:hypothetical protein